MIALATAALLLPLVRIDDPQALQKALRFEARLRGLSVESVDVQDVQVTDPVQPREAAEDADPLTTCK